MSSALCSRDSKMGSRATRLMRNFNIENRAHREISKTKPKAAPRHPASSSTPQEGIAGEKAVLEAANRSR